MAHAAGAEPGRGRMWWRLALLGLPGTLSVALIPLDGFGPPPLDPALLKLLVVIQPTVLMLLAIALGLWAAPKVGLDAPAVRAWAERRPILPALAPQLAPAALVGLAMAVMLVGFWWVVRAQAFAAPVIALEMPLATKLLYGGIVEELLLRWGVMSLFVWIAWRLGGAARPVPAGRCGARWSRPPPCSRPGICRCSMSCCPPPPAGSSAWCSWGTSFPACSSAGSTGGAAWRRRSSPMRSPICSARPRWRCFLEKGDERCAGGAQTARRARLALPRRAVPGMRRIVPLMGQ